MIDIAGLYKIFGDDPAGLLPLVRDKGMGKDELLARHNGVLALRDINLSVPDKSIQVVMGLSGSGKSTLIRHINRLIDPTAGRVLVGGGGGGAVGRGGGGRRGGGPVVGRGGPAGWVEMGVAGREALEAADAFWREGSAPAFGHAPL